MTNEVKSRERPVLDGLKAGYDASTRLQSELPDDCVARAEKYDARGILGKAGSLLGTVGGELASYATFGLLTNYKTYNIEDDKVSLFRKRTNGEETLEDSVDDTDYKDEWDKTFREIDLEMGVDDYVCSRSKNRYSVRRKGGSRRAGIRDKDLRNENVKPNDLENEVGGTYEVRSGSAVVRRGVATGVYEVVDSEFVDGDDGEIRTYLLTGKVLENKTLETKKKGRLVRPINQTYVSNSTVYDGNNHFGSLVNLGALNRNELWADIARKYENDLAREEAKNNLSETDPRVYFDNMDSGIKKASSFTSTGRGWNDLASKELSDRERMFRQLLAYGRNRAFLAANHELAEDAIDFAYKSRFGIPVLIISEDVEYPEEYAALTEEEKNELRRRILG